MLNEPNPFAVASVATAEGDVPMDRTRVEQAASTPTDATLAATLALTPGNSVGHCPADARGTTIEPVTDTTPPPLQATYTTPVAPSTATLPGVHVLGRVMAVTGEQLHGAARMAGPSVEQFRPPKRGAGLVQVRVCVCVHELTAAVGEATHAPGSHAV